MFFVFNTGRCGSHTIAHLLSQSPDCICLHEPEPVLIKEAALFHYGLISDEMLKAIVVSTRAPRLMGRRYGEANQKLSFMIPVLARAFPEAQFIWLVRDGRDVLASTYYSHQWYTPVEEIAFNRVKPYPASVKVWSWYRLRGDLSGDMSSADWEVLPRFEKNCWVWSKTNSVIGGDLAQLPPERSLLVKLETLPAQLPEIGRFLGIRIPDGLHMERRNVSSTASIPWEEWPAEQQQAFDRWCGPMMSRFYPDWRTTPRPPRPRPQPVQPRLGFGWLRAWSKTLGLKLRS
jgi:hypothetical protein